MTIKKIILTLMMLCCMTVAWAGSGDGSREHPFTGDWNGAVLTRYLKLGHYLALDCELLCDVVYITDTELDRVIVNGASSWTVGDPIGETPWDAYGDYCSCNTLSQRQEDLFVVSSFSYWGGVLRVSGYYTGLYESSVVGWIAVNTREELQRVVSENNNARIRVVGDIDMGGSGLNVDFHGKLDGHWQVDGEDVTYTIRNLNGPLFRTMSDASVSNIRLDSVRYTVDDENVPNSGTFANRADRTKFSNVEVSNCYIYIDSNGGNAEGTVGGFVGWAYQCQFNNVTLRSTEIITDEIRAGGIAGYSHECGFFDCLVDEQCGIYSDGQEVGKDIFDWDYRSYVGGFCGWDLLSTFMNCANLALVAGDCDFIGGLVGYANMTGIYDCFNAGPVLSLDKRYFEGVLLSRKNLEEGNYNYGGHTFSVMKLDQSIIDKIANDDCVGGLVGWALNSTKLKSCVNFGPYATTGGYSGGIAGVIDFEISNCLNMPSATDPFASKDNHGGIAGYASSVIDRLCSCLSLNGTKVVGGSYYPLKIEEVFNNYSNSGTSTDNEKPVTDDDLASGVLAMKLNSTEYNQKKGVFPWQQNLGTDAFPMIGDKGVCHTRNVTNEFGTLCVPYALKSNDKIWYYEFTGSRRDEDGFASLMFDYVEDVEPGTPVLFHTTELGEIAFANEDSCLYAEAPVYPELSEWDMFGTYRSLVFEGDEAQSIYYVSGGAIKNARRATIAPFRSYFRYTRDGGDDSAPGGYGGGPGGYANVRFVLEEANGESNVIHLVYDGDNNALRNATSSNTYSLMGTEVGEGYRGIVIRNGKKVLIK